jgi:hypothetical protein
LPSPEPIGRTGSASSRCRVLPSSRAVGCALEGPPASYRPMGSAFPPRGSSTSWSSPAGREPYDRSACLPRPFAPLRSITRSSATPSSGVTGSLEVCSPTAQPNRGEPPLPELPPPGPVASLPFLPASTPCSRRDLPGFSTGRARGVHPSELDTARIAVASRRNLPSCDWLTRRHGTEQLLSFGGTRLPGPWSGSIAFRLRRMTRWSSGASFEVPCVPDHRRPVVIAAAVRTAVRRGLAPGV